MITFRTVLTRILMWMLKFLSISQLESLMVQLLSSRTHDMSSNEALRLLFRLDAALYSLEGKKAVEYGGGIHTKHRHTRYHDFFIDYIRPDERILDIGCGIGALAYDVAEQAKAYVTAIDLNPNHIEKATKQYNHPRVRYVIGDAMQKLPDGPFDAVILSNVLEHLRERPVFLRRIRETVSPKRFLIRVPLLERDWRVPLKQELGVEWRLDPSHETEYTLESFAEELAVTGLRIDFQVVKWGEIWAVALPNE